MPWPPPSLMTSLEMDLPISGGELSALPPLKGLISVQCFDFVEDYILINFIKRKFNTRNIAIEAFQGPSEIRTPLACPLAPPE